MGINKLGSIDLNEQFQKALDRMENTSRHVFITGKAGTGKSPLLDYFRNHTSKKLIVLAPTGVSALNVRGKTIHSFFGFKPNVTLKSIKKMRGNKQNIYKERDAIVIDEASMVRADLLDCIDKFLRLNTGKKKPFGGVQMIFIGDLYQLPPVVTGNEKEFYIWLTSINSAAEKINREHLSRIGFPVVTYSGILYGDFKEDSLPTQIDLQIKKDAQVMLLNNDSLFRWVNGSIGKIVDIEQRKGEEDVIIVELVTGEVVEVLPYRWELFNYYFDKGKKTIESEAVGSFTQT